MRHKLAYTFEGSRATWRKGVEAFLHGVETSPAEVTAKNSMTIINEPGLGNRPDVAPSGYALRSPAV